jgi:hypothetical protein
MKLFKRKVRADKVAFSLQAAQCAGLVQSVDLLKRIRVTASDEERASFGCGENFRLLDFYGVRHVEVRIEHLDSDRARGTFYFSTPRLHATVEISLQREKTSITRLSHDGFQDKKEFERWKAVQGRVCIFHASLETGKYSDFSDGFACLRDSELTSQEDLLLKRPVNYD